MSLFLAERVRSMAEAFEVMAASPYPGPLSPQQIYAAVAADLRDALREFGERPTPVDPIEPSSLDGARHATTEPGDPPPESAPGYEPAALPKMRWPSELPTGVAHEDER